jgi:hypothetical protein
MLSARQIGAAMVVAALGACGGPVLQNVPKPDPAIVAGLAAGAAGAATLANPDAAARIQEAKKPERDPRPVATKETVPSGVLDRLDEKQAKKPADGADADAAPPTVTPAAMPADDEMSKVTSPIPLKR